MLLCFKIVTLNGKNQSFMLMNLIKLPLDKQIGTPVRNKVTNSRTKNFSQQIITTMDFQCLLVIIHQRSGSKDGI